MEWAYFGSAFELLEKDVGPCLQSNWRLVLATAVIGYVTLNRVNKLVKVIMLIRFFSG